MEQRHETQKAKQARALRTEQRLLDALVKLLGKKPFAELTVAELAAEAGFTTGAIYRRFADKDDVLRAAFNRFVEERTKIYERSYSDELSDHALIKAYFVNLMQFTLENIHLIRAASDLNDTGSYNLVVQARAETAEWLARRMRTSGLSDEELAKRFGMVLRVAGATFRDTFLSGRGAAPIPEDRCAENERALERLCGNLADMASSYLELERPD